MNKEKFFIEEYGYLSEKNNLDADSDVSTAFLNYFMERNLDSIKELTAAKLKALNIATNFTVLMKIDNTGNLADFDKINEKGILICFAEKFDSIYEYYIKSINTIFKLFNHADSVLKEDIIYSKKISDIKKRKNKVFETDINNYFGRLYKRYEEDRKNYIFGEAFHDVQIKDNHLYYNPNSRNLISYYDRAEIRRLKVKDDCEFLGEVLKRNTEKKKVPNKTDKNQQAQQKKYMAEFEQVKADYDKLTTVSEPNG